MFRQIMVPLDGSALAERPLAIVEQLAPVTGATIHLVTVAEPLPHPGWAPMPAYVDPTIYELTTANTTAYLGRQRDRLARAGAAAHIALLGGSAVASLLDYERDAGIDLVVMASHGRTGLARFALGSVAGQLIQYGTAPVLLVRAFGDDSLPDRVLVPLDGSPLAEQALGAVRVLAHRLVKAVTLLRAVRHDEQRAEAQQYLDGQATRLQLEGFTVDARVEVGDPATLIIAAAGLERLVVMATHGRSGPSRWALGSVADRVTHGGTAPVLLLRKQS